MDFKKICIIGAGNMGGAIAAGIAGSPYFRPGNLCVTALSQGSLDKVKAAVPDIVTSTDNAWAATGADLVVMAVKPWQLENVAMEIKPVLDYTGCTIASVVAGVEFSDLTEMFRKDGCCAPALLRIIPNTAISLKKSTTFIASCRTPGPVLENVVKLFRCMGTVVEVQESMMAAGTSLASCGIAYALKYLDASMKGGTRLGFTEKEARDIVMSTMKGAIALLETYGTLPQQEIDKVTTPGGYTFRGLAAMEEKGFSDAVLSGLESSM